MVTWSARVGRRVIRHRQGPGEFACLIGLAAGPSTWTILPSRSSAPEPVSRLVSCATGAMDYDLWRRLSQRFAMTNLPLPLVSYREGHASMTATYGDRALEGEWIAIRSLTAKIGLAPEPPQRALQHLALLRLLAFDGNDDALAGDTRGVFPPRALLRFRVGVVRRALRRGLLAARRGEIRSAGTSVMAAVGALSP